MGIKVKEVGSDYISIMIDDHEFRIRAGFSATNEEDMVWRDFNQYGFYSSEIKLGTIIKNDKDLSWVNSSLETELTENISSYREAFSIWEKYKFIL